MIGRPRKAIRSEDGDDQPRKPIFEDWRPPPNPTCKSDWVSDPISQFWGFAGTRELVLRCCVAACQKGLK